MMKKLTENKFFPFYQQYFRSHLLFVASLLALIIVGVATSNINPFLYGRMIDFITENNLSNLRVYIAVYFFVTLGSVGLGMLEGYIGQMFSFKISNEVRKNLFNKIIRMRFKRLDEYAVGELISRLESDAGAIVNYYIDVATSIVLIVFNLIVSIYFVFSISIGLSVISILFIPFSIMNTIIFRKKFRELSIMQKEYSDKYFGFINESFSNIKGMRSYQLEDTFSDSFNGFIAKNLRLTKKSIYLGNVMNILNRLVSLTFVLINIYLAAVFISEGKLTIGSMVAFNTYIDKLFNAVSRILTLNISAQNVAVSLDRIEKLQNEPDETGLYNRNDKQDNFSIQQIAVKDLSFKYKEKYVLSGLSIVCNRPGFYSIVGKNGCGKSTLAKLLMRFYDSDDGEIAINGININKYGIQDIRKHITYIQKEVFITNDIIINNIKLANPNASDTEIKLACKKAGLTEMIDMLPQKSETILGENGSFLSSGQKQKINIARVLVRNSPIVLLDEVTSDLDGKSEKEIVQLIREIANQAIVIFISHKVTSIEKSDIIFVMDDGVLQAQGTHNQLSISNELYQELFTYTGENQ